jgi:hypothetical protein
MASPRPRAFRPYRAAVYVLYIVIVGFLSALPLIAVVRGLVAEARIEAPPRPPLVTSAPDTPLSPTEAQACFSALGELRVELSDRFSALGDLAGREGRDALRAWNEELRIWEATLWSVGEECRLHEPAGDPRAEALAPLLGSLERLARAYGNHATRMVMDDAATFEEVRVGFEAARQAVAP